MSFDKRYPNRKDWRKPYKGSARFDRSCRPGGGCGWCLKNRTYRAQRNDALVRDLERSGA